MSKLSKYGWVKVCIPLIKPNPYTRIATLVMKAIFV